MIKKIPAKTILLSIQKYLLFIFFILITADCFSQTFSTNCSVSGFQQLPVNASPCTNFTLISWSVNTPVNAPNNPTCNGVIGAGRDGWGWFTATTTISNVEYVNKNGDAMIFIYSGTCAGLVQIACADDWIVNNPEIVTFPTTVGSNYYVRIVSKATANTMLGSICVWGTVIPPPCSPVPANDDPCSAINLTVGATCTYNTYTNACATPTNSIPPPGCGNYIGSDVWFKATVPASGQLTVTTNTGVMSDGAMALYTATSCSTGFALVTCDDNSSGNAQMPKIIATGLNPGDVVYIRVWENGDDNNGTFKICAIDGSPCGALAANDDPCGATLLAVPVTCTFTTYTNLCSSNSTSLPNIPDPSCGAYAGGDVWFKVVVPASGSLSVKTNTMVMKDGAMALYSGSCGGAFTEIDCDDDNGPGLMPWLVESGLAPGSTVYIRMWSYNNSQNGTFRMCVTDPCPSGTPVNDLPCNATVLPIGINFPTSNGCATNTSDPAMPACFTNINGLPQMNTVWYKFTAVSTCTKIKTYPGTMGNTQMAVYGGTCAALGAVLAGGCNDNYQPCGASGVTYRSSFLQINTVVGSTYYIMVDGVNGQTGSFNIQVIDGGSWAACANNLAPVTGQDCVVPLPICSYNTLVPNPGFLTSGNVCDFAAPGACAGTIAGCSGCATTCLCTGERGSSWYKIVIGTVVGTQYLEFSIVPNNYPGLYPGDETDYDFALFGPNPSCANLTSPLRCNYNPLGVTGVYGAVAGQAPPAYPGFDGAFREQVPVNTGEIYYLNISNFETNKIGYTLKIEPTTPLANVIPPGGTLIWTGSVDNNWFNAGNWGGCQIPDCSVNAVIPGFPANQPLINAVNANCRNIDINLDATLTINSGFELNVCGDFLNNGTLTANANSTVLFQDTSANFSILHDQQISGSVTGSNKFWNVTVSKPVGFKVITNQNIDMAGNFLVSGAGGLGGNLTATNKYHKVAGNFTVESAPLVATYTPATVLEFNGAAQTYLNRGVLDSVVMNQSAGGTVTLLDHGLLGTAWMQLAATGTLTLTTGRIIAGFSHASDNRVDLYNRTTAATSIGSTTSYVEGALRRYMNNTGGIGTYNFPVGSPGRGYELIGFNITTALPVSVNYWNVFFDESTIPASPLYAMECSSQYHQGGLLALNHGIWSVQSTPGTLASGIMNVTNYNRSYTNPVGNGWTVQYDKALDNSIGNWLLEPFPAFPCANPLIGSVLRNSMRASVLFTGNPVWFATAQSSVPLPVELLSLDARAAKNSILLNWTTASEKNNKGFDVERTTSPPDNFAKIGWIEGHGSSPITHNYNFEDAAVKGGIEYYYRLKQIDYNKNFEYSKIVSAKIDQSVIILNVIPNPYSGYTNIIYTLTEQSRVKLEVYNSMGQKVATLINGLQTAGQYTFDFSAKALGYSKGIYSVVIQVNDQVFSKRIMEIE
jgi:hypothetical protein